ncbi:MAG: signal recognition particle subunit SRP19/SEC65 family protein [Candidatus Poseidoniaceae archaeon]
MEHNPDRLSIWPGYFNAKISRRNGRRVPKDASVIKPDLEGLFLAARKVGLRKIKREEGSNHPRRPHAGEGRLWVSRVGSKQSIGANSKEEILQLIGGEWRQMQRDLKEAKADREEKGPQTGDRRARSQRKGSNRQSSKEPSTKKSFKKRGFKN